MVALSVRRFFLPILILLAAALCPVFAGIVSIGNSPSYASLGQNMGIYANLSGSNITDIYANVTNPLGVSELYAMDSLGGSSYQYGYYIPDDNSSIGNYTYFVTISEEGTIENSATKQFYALKPEVTIWTEPMAAELNSSVGLYANISGLDISNVFLNVTIPSGESMLYSMGNAGNSTYFYNLTIPFNESYYGTCPYFVKFLDEGHAFQSNESYFFVLWPGGLLQNVTINIQILPTCMATIVRYVPFDVQKQYTQNSTLPMLVYFENVGNINITDKYFYLSVQNSASTDIWSDSGSGYPDKAVELGDYGFYWNIWSTGLSPFGNYTATAVLKYGSLINNQSMNMSLLSLEASANCTREDINVSCLSERTVSSSLYTVSRLIINTNETSSAFVDGMGNGTVGYEGMGSVNGTDYRAFLFKLSNCDRYCYACLSNDLNSSGMNLSQDDCAFEGNPINSSGRYVDNITSNGSSVEFGVKVILGRSIKITYNCTILGDNVTAECVINVECNGTIERIEDFQIVNLTTIVPTPVPLPQPQPQPQPQPRPQPQPQPEPEPVPKKSELAIDIKPLNDSIRGEEGAWIPEIFNVTNIGNVNATNITLIPIVPDGWEVKDAIVSFLEVGKTVNRTIFVKPPYTALGQYLIPVKARGENVTLALDYFQLSIIEGINRTRLEIVEIPREISFQVDSIGSIPILIKNTGHLPLHDINLRMENGEGCIESYNYTAVPELNESNTSSMILTVKTKKSPSICNTTVIVWSREGAYAFSLLTIFTTPNILSPPVPLLPLLAFILIFIELLLLRRKKQKVLRGESSRYTDIAIVLVFIALVIVISLTMAEYFGYSIDKILAAKLAS